MLNYGWINTKHFLIRPSEYISKFLKEVDVNLNLCRGTIGSDEDIFYNVRVPRDAYWYNI